VVYFVYRERRLNARVKKARQGREGYFLESYTFDYEHKLYRLERREHSVTLKFL